MTRFGSLLIASAFALARAVAAGPVAPCGDVNDDGSVSAADIAVYRGFLADPSGAPLSAAGAGKCLVHASAAGCGVSNVVVLRRALEAPPLLPGIAPVCSAAAGTSLTVALAPGSRRSAIVTSDGGTLMTEAPDGTRFTLTVPPNAIEVPGGVSVTLEAAASVSGLPASGGVRASAQITPDGLLFRVPAHLRVELPAPVAPSDLLAFTYSGGGSGAYFVPVVPDFERPNEVTLVLDHASGHGVAAGTPGDPEGSPSPATDPDAPYLQAFADLSQEAVRSRVADPSYDPFDDEVWTGLIYQTFEEWLSAIIDAPSSASCASVERDVRSIAQWNRYADLLAQNVESFDRLAELPAKLGELDARFASVVEGTTSGCATRTVCEQTAAVDELLGCETLVEHLAASTGLAFAGITASEYSAVCPGAAGWIEVVPPVVELCPGSSRPLAVSARRLDGTAATLGEVTWASSDSQIASFADGLLTSTVPGEAELTLELECGIQLTTRVFSRPVPDMLGAYLGSGSEVTRACTNPASDGYGLGRAGVTVSSQIDNGDGSATLAGSLTGVTYAGDSVFAGVVQCGGALSGVANYTEPKICYDPNTFEEYDCVVAGTTSFSGRVTSTTGSTARTVSLRWSSQDTVEETCATRGSGSLTR